MSVHLDFLLLHIASHRGCELGYAWNVRRPYEIMPINNFHSKQSQQSYFNPYEN
jgi:hypothetical protein